MILRDEQPVDGGNAGAINGSVSAPVQLPTVKAPDTTSKEPSNLPKEIADMEFGKGNGIDDFEVEQLPEQGVDTTKPLVKEEKKAETLKENKKEIEPKKEEPLKEEKKQVSPLDRLTKPPGQRKEDANGKKTTDVTPQKPLTPANRDYTGYTTQEAAALKQMSNEGFELASKLIKENKELAKLKDSSIYQHEQAYLLDPQYRQLREDAHYANKEGEYWKGQLIDMDSGKDFVPIVGWNQDGSPKLGTPRKPTKMDEENCRIAVMNCNNVVGQLNGRIQQFRGQYKQTVQTDLQAIQNYRKSQFGWVADSKYLDNVINVEGLGERSLRQIREDVRSMLPVYMQNHPLAEVLGDLVIGIRLKDSELSELRNTKQVEGVKQEEQQRVEPSSNGSNRTRSKGEPVHGVSEFNIAPELGIN